MEQGRPTDPRARAREAAAPRVFALLIGALFLILAATLLRAGEGPEAGCATVRTASICQQTSFRPDALPAPPRPSTSTLMRT